MTNTMQSVATRNFSRKTLAGLKRAGVSIAYSQWLPGVDGSYATGETGYMTTDGRLLTFMQVLALAGGK